MVSATRPRDENGSFVFIESNTTGTGQLCLRRARERGFRVLFLTARPELYPYLSAEMVAPHVVDTGDVAAICRLLAQQGDVVGVMSTSEYFIETAAQVAARLSLPGPDVEGVRNCRDKGRLARVLERAGVNAPETFQVDAPALLEQLAPKLKFPVVVKPIFGSGSVGVRLVATAAELSAVGRRMLSEPRNERGMAVPPDILIQTFLPGEEFSVEVFSTGGRDHVVGITRKHLGAAPFFVEMGHDFPARVGPATARALQSLVTEALRAVGYRAGPSHVECRVGSDGRPAIIEINPRLAGGMIPKVVEMAIGVDLLGAVVDFSAGREVELTPVRERCAAIRFFAAERAGVVEALHSPLGEPRTDDVEAVFAALKPVGTYVEPQGDFRDRIAYVIAASERPEVLDQALRSLLAHEVVQLSEPRAGDEGRIRKLLTPEALEIVRKLPPPQERIAELERLAAIDEAHLLMLVEAGILQAAAVAPVLTEIAAMRAARFAALVDRQAPRGIYALYEQSLLARLGPQVAGAVHTARSRNDIHACLFKLEAREWLTHTFRALWRLRAALLAKAADTLDVVLPVYSQFQPGQPGVLAYYLWSLDCALARDQQALAQLVDDLQVCPLGAGAGAGTDFPIRPQVTAELLGFSTSHHSALDAVASRDLALRLLGAWAVCSTNLSRLAQDLQLWTMADVGLFTLPDELAGGSSLMPQKKNPYLLEIVKGKLVALPSALGFALHAMQKTPFSNAIEVGTEGVSQCGSSATALADSCDLLRLMIEGLSPRPGVGEALARRGVVVATQVANALVRAGTMTFHEAHRAVGSRIAGALDVGGDPLAALAGLTEETFDDVGAAARALRHGGGPGVVGEQLGEARGALRRDADEFHRRSSIWSVAERRRSAAVQALIARVTDPGAGGSDD